MSVYKVAQDVEADDKLIGPFSFRQFIYLIVVAISMALAWGLAQIFILLAIIPVPFMLFFGALALPLRKDQPMETYLAAILAFHMKPKKRIWIPDGVEFLVHITAPKEVDTVRTKDLSQTEAERRLSYLANIVDTEGWAVRGVQSSEAGNTTAMESSMYYEAQQIPDMLDEQSGVSSNIDAMMNDAAARRHDQMLAGFQAAAARATMPQPPVTPPQAIAPSQPMQQPSVYPSQPQPTTQPPQPAPRPTMPDPLSYLNDPYAVNMYTKTVDTIPHDQKTSQNTSEITVNPDIMNLVNNSENLSVETIAHEANRINNKKHGDDEVVISLH